ncbi:unnamed protein product [Ilex paraguariensis]|uniref:Bidirectional sugar transporter SWEET n=1 Tax=Ilex paraguariensis TaxID=185542 RepID=A0ABC8RHB1_9AQUA
MAIFDHHHPWVLTFGVLGKFTYFPLLVFSANHEAGPKCTIISSGNIVSIFVYLSPLPTYIRIYKRKSTLGFQSLPYVVALFSAMLWLYYAFLKKDALLLISINLFGCVIETIYIGVYLFYASKEAKNHTTKLLASLNVGLFSAIFLFTLFLAKDSNRVVIVGWICVAVSVSVFAAPLSIVFQVVRTRSVEFMPFTLSFFLTLSAVMWFAYGLLLKDLCVALPNILGFFLGLLQMLLYGIYRNAKKVVEEKKQPEHIINIAVVGDCEIHQFEPKTSGSGSGNVVAEEEKKDEQTDGHHKTVASEDDEPGGMNVQTVSPVLVMCAA